MLRVLFPPLYDVMGLTTLHKRKKKIASQSCCNQYLFHPVICHFDQITLLISTKLAEKS